MHVGECIPDSGVNSLSFSPGFGLPSLGRSSTGLQSASVPYDLFPNPPTSSGLLLPCHSHPMPLSGDNARTSANAPGKSSPRHHRGAEGASALAQRRRSSAEKHGRYACRSVCVRRGGESSFECCCSLRDVPECEAPALRTSPGQSAEMMPQAEQPRRCAARMPTGASLSVRVAPACCRVVAW